MVAGPEDKYRLTIGGGVGQGGDAMAYSNGMQFSTYDSDNDKDNSNCSFVAQGGWWYNACYQANLNGPHTIPTLPGVDQKWARLIWSDNGDPTPYYIPSVEMKLRPKHCNLNEVSC